MSIKAIKLQNARSIHNSGYVDIKPITILVGQNSSGKSTFLRTLPLLRQSLSGSGNSTIQFYGAYVDFGTFEKYVRRGQKNVVIGIEIVPNMDKTGILYRRAREFLNRGDSIFIELLITGNDLINEIRSISIDINGNKIKINAKDSEVAEVTANGVDVSEMFKDVFLSPTLGIIPVLTTVGGDDNDIESGSYRNIPQSRFFLSLGEMDGRVSPQTIYSLYRTIKISRKQEIIEQFQSNTKLPPNINFNLRQSLENSEYVDSFLATYLSSRLDEILRLIGSELTDVLASVKYVGPLRDISQRYFRSAGGGSEIDVKGQNLSSYISTLSPKEQSELDDWMVSKIGYRFSLKNEGAHFSFVAVDPDNGQEFSFSDLGVGYSQIAPILFQIWDSIYRNSGNIISSQGLNNTLFSLSRLSSSESLILIEQPELHLHPKMQALVAKIIAESYIESAKSNRSIKFIIETHSEHIISMLGILTASGDLSKDDVNVVMFERLSSTQTKTKQTSFTKEGSLKNWPLDFLDPDYI